MAVHLLLHACNAAMAAKVHVSLHHNLHGPHVLILVCGLRVLILANGAPRSVRVSYR